MYVSHSKVFHFLEYILPWRVNFRIFITISNRESSEIIFENGAESYACSKYERGVGELIANYGKLECL